jgi:hypothetical protein
VLSGAVVIGVLIATRSTLLQQSETLSTSQRTASWLRSKALPWQQATPRQRLHSKDKRPRQAR